MEEIIDFLGEYAETLEAMEQKQIEKLGLLMTRELDKVEQTIMMQEAMDKKLENMEQRRRKLFVSYGIEGRTLKQIAEDAGPERNLWTCTAEWTEPLAIYSITTRRRRR